MRSEEELRELDDPAKGDGSYRAEVAQAAEAQIDAATDTEPASPEADWDNLTEAERREAIGTPLPAAPDSAEQRDASTDPAAVDWNAFAREFNFHLAGQGRQNRHTNKKNLRIALETSEHVATTTPKAFLADAVACEAVPLVKDESHGYLFAEEVLADE